MADITQPHEPGRIVQVCVKLVMLQHLHGHGGWERLDASASRHRGQQLTSRRFSLVTCTSSLFLSIWLGCGMCSLKISRARVTRAGWATQVPSCPFFTSLSLSAFTWNVGSSRQSATLTLPSLFVKDTSNVCSHRHTCAGGTSAADSAYSYRGDGWPSMSDHMTAFEG